MNSSVQSDVELSAVLNLVPYLDIDFNYDEGKTLSDIVLLNEKRFTDKDGNLDPTFKILKDAIDTHEEYGKIVLVDQSSTNETGAWNDDLIQGCTFRDADGNYYVAFRGTGDGRWADNGNGMTATSTQMQEAAAAYFDEMAEKYLIDASNQGKKIIVTGHSKGGNEAQYTYLAAKHEEIIDACISLDGQGFSESAIERFKKRFGDEYEEKLQNMYSVNGENDFVHDLGIVIIPEDNTYFVGTSGSGFNSLHALENMVGDNGKYTGLVWVNPETGQPYEQGEIGELAKKISEKMMQMNPEDLNGAAIAVMIFVDAAMNKKLDELLLGQFNDDILGELNVNPADFIDLLAHGLPAAIETLFLTEEGQVILGQLINTAANYLYDEYGIGGVIGGFALGAFALTFVVAPIVLDLVILNNVIDFTIDVINKIADVTEKIKQFISDIKEAVIQTINKIISKLRTLTPGYKYSTANPQVTLDTYKLNLYSQRISKVIVGYPNWMVESIRFIGE